MAEISKYIAAAGAFQAVVDYAWQHGDAAALPDSLAAAVLAGLHEAAMDAHDAAMAEAETTGMGPFVWEILDDFEEEGVLEDSASVAGAEAVRDMWLGCAQAASMGEEEVSV